MSKLKSTLQSNGGLGALISMGPLEGMLNTLVEQQNDLATAVEKINETLGTLATRDEVHCAHVPGAAYSADTKPAVPGQPTFYVKQLDLAVRHATCMLAISPACVPLQVKALEDSINERLTRHERHLELLEIGRKTSEQIAADMPKLKNDIAQKMREQEQHAANELSKATQVGFLC